MNSNRPDSRNYIVALLLSALVLLFWHFFFIAPMAERQKLAAERAAAAQKLAEGEGAAGPAATGVPGMPASAGPVQAQTREAALASGGGRLVFENDKVDGSIRLTGAQIDDLRLRKYRETLDPTSDEVIFLTPRGTASATFAETGWVPAPGSQTRVPDATSVWSSSSTTLAPGKPVTLTWDNGQGIVFIRRIAIDENYMFTVTDGVQNNTGAPVTLFPSAIATREGEPKHTPQWTLHEGLFGVLAGLLEKYTYADLRDAKDPEAKFEGTGGWLGITDKYWMVTVVPPQNEKYTGRFSIARERQGEVFRADYLLQPRNVAAGGNTSVTHHVFAGAKIVSLVEAYQQQLGILRYDMTIDWGWFSFFTYWIFKALDVINHQVGNFGIAIIILTIIVKIIFYPLANASYVSITKLKKIQPEMQELQLRYKDDKPKMQQELIALYRREKVNPFMGCVPMLLQIPIFFSLYKVLFVTIEMRHAPFFGWIQDLAAADPTSIFNLFGLLPYSVPEWLLVGIWPLLMGFTMWFQMKMSPPSPDPTQRQVMMFMPPVFTYLMATFPAGLVIYWTVNNVLSIGQQYIIMRRLNVPLDVSFKLPGWIGRALGRPPTSGTT
ncbi:MAG: membrane protein insertase YidC [Alphaproteobacteria bacterium]